MNETSTFKIVVIAVFVLSMVIGIVLFAISKVGSTGESNLVIWGPISADQFHAAYIASSVAHSKTIKVEYVEKDPTTFDAEFTEALAEGSGPDIVILRDEYLYKERNKLFVIPFANYSERTFKDTFIEGGELYLTPEGVLALPFMVDPMVMYWNRDMFSNALISQSPKYWDEITPMLDKITRKDTSGNVLTSTIALGEWRNILNSKEVFATLLLQAGTPIVARTKDGVKSQLTAQFNYPVRPGQSALNFYTQFSNPTSPNYTWNRSLPNSLTFFLSGKLSMYIGFASEIFGIQQKNPNLNFDVSVVPQIRDAERQTVYAHIYSLSIVKQSKQLAGAYTAVLALIEPAAINALAPITNLPPVRRDLLASRPSDAFKVVFYNSALISKSWLDPDPKASSNTFRDMIEGVTSGNLRSTEALERANDELNSQIQ